MRPAPAPANGRAIGLDVARALAIAGMVLVNFELSLTKSAEPSWLAALTSLVQGRASALFVILAGFGIQLMATAQGDLRRTRVVVLRRALFLAAIGYAFLPLWPADILHFYALYFVVGAVALGRSARGLWIGATIVVVGFLVFGLPVYDRGWNFETLEYAGLWTLEGSLRNLFLNGFHPVLPWSAFLLWGMWLARRYRSGALRGPRPIVVGAAVAVVVELVSRGLIAAAAGDDDLAALVGTASIPPVPGYMFAAGATATAVLLGCLYLVDERDALPHRVLRPLAHTGQLALTLYVAHVVVGIGAFHETGADLTLPETVAWWAGFCVLAAAASHAYRTFFATGPFEWLLRRAGGRSSPRAPVSRPD
ncbi:hypothetical protein Pla163_06880 [Planctomycetes bacterium Pla163]|uniref:DUF418 domain-containing protein n=1 Tax=Rohdeia mirabilis TaxID=2528008 RepID=A0A518CWJ4_9BACT|nr:hypothetical protein Pla163_06880 [Planctomycetes bacterium Pla163]